MTPRNKKILIGAICIIIIIIAFTMYKRKEHFSSGSEKIVLYYSPNCGHCKAMSGVWEIFQKQINDKSDSVSAEKVNCIENKCDVQGFPTIKFFKKDGTVVVFDGERTVDAFKRFVDTNRS